MIGIIAAEKKEMLAIKELMYGVKVETHHKLVYCIGTIKDKRCVLVECGVGKVNSARVTQSLIDLYNPNYIINVGSAGSTVPELNIEDIVIGTELIQYDFDVSDISFVTKGHECNGCSNNCEILKIFKNNKLIDAWGNRCPKGVRS